MIGVYDWEDYVEIYGRTSNMGGDNGGVYIPWVEVPQLIERLRKLQYDHDAKLSKGDCK